MKRLERFCLRGCAYTVLLLFAFYIFAALTGAVGDFMPSARFLLITLFGFIISFAEMIYAEIKLRFILRGLIHYLILLAFFFIVFVVSGNLVIKGAGTVFAAVILFTVLYFVILATVHFCGKGISRLDSSLDKKTASKDKADKKANAYSPRFKD